MAHYNWEQLKKEYILGEFKSLNEFAELKGLKINGNFKKQTKGWADEKELWENQKSTKIINKTIEKVAEKEASRNMRFLNISDMALDAIEEYMKDKKYMKHIIKYKNYVDGKADSEELVAELLDVPDTKAFANMITSLEKIQKGQRTAEGLDRPQQQEDGNIDKLIDAISRSK
jgi:hypothetical protein